MTQSLSDLDFCVIDTETTGGRAAFNRIIDVAVLHFRGGEIIETYQTLINPERPIPLWISNLTGITDHMVEDAPTFGEIADDLHSFLNRGVFTAHNAGFDYSFVQEEFRRLGREFNRPQCCTLRLARHLYSDLPSRSLGMLCEHMLIDIWDRHRAFGDAEATVYVLKEILRKLKDEQGINTWTDLDAYARFGQMVLPDGIPIEILSQLPPRPGTYLFKDEKGKLVHKGKAKDIQRRIRTFFSQANQSKKSNHFRSCVRSIEVLAEH